MSPVSTRITIELGKRGGKPLVFADLGLLSRLSEAGPMAILSNLFSFDDFLNCAVHPTGGSPGVGQDFASQRLRQPIANLADHLCRHPPLAQRLERLHEQTSFPQPKSGLLERRVLKGKRRIADLMAAIRTVGEIRHAAGHHRSPDDTTNLAASG